jgi:hypothetical protein
LLGTIADRAAAPADKKITELGGISKRTAARLGVPRIHVMSTKPKGDTYRVP